MTTESDFYDKIIIGDADLDRLNDAVNGEPGTWTTDDGTTVKNLRLVLSELEGMGASLYDTETIGLANTSDGDLFIVKGSASVFGRLFKNVGGAAVDQNISLPSSSALNALETLIFNEESRAIAAEQGLSSDIFDLADDVAEINALKTRLDLEIVDRVQDDEDIRDLVTAETAARVALSNTLSAADSAEVTARTQGDESAEASADTALIAQPSVTEFRDQFTSVITGPISARTPLTIGEVVDSPLVGGCLRIEGDDSDPVSGKAVLAHRVPTNIVPGHVYRVRVWIGRTSIVDPVGHAIELRVQPMDFRKVALSQIMFTSVNPVAGDTVELSYTFGTDDSNDVTLLSATRHATIFLDIFGDAHKTDIANFDIQDITEDAAAPIIESPIVGEWDASSGVFPGGGAGNKGDRWLVTTAGSTDGRIFDTNDYLIALVDNPSTATYAGNWVGQSRSEFVTSINGERGDINNVVTQSATETLQNKTLESPVIVGGIDVTGLSGAELKALNKSLGNDIAIPSMYGVNAVGNVDTTDSFQAFLDSDAPQKIALPGDYRIDGELFLTTTLKLKGFRGETFLHQYGKTLLRTGPDVERAIFQGMSMKLMAPGADMSYTMAAFQAHRNCLFADIDCAGYDNSLILKRIIEPDDEIPSTRNTWHRWATGNVGGLQITAGRDNFTVWHTWGGTTDTVTVPFDWTEYYSSSIKIGYLDDNMVFQEISYLDGDWTVIFDGNGWPTITASAGNPPNGQTWLITSGNPDPQNHLMFSNDIYSEVKTDRIKYFGNQHIQWHDGASVYGGRFVPAEEGCVSVISNPWFKTLRGHGGNDGAFYHGTNFGLNPGNIDDRSTVYHFRDGPGTFGNRYDIVVDYGLRDRTGFVSIIEDFDGKNVLLPATVTSDGSNIVTLTGDDPGTFDVRDYLTLMGASPDQIKINGRPFKVVSINSATEIQTTQAVPTVTDRPIFRFNPQLETSHVLNAAGGFGEGSRLSEGRMLSVRKGVSNNQNGLVTIPNGVKTFQVQTDLTRPLTEEDDVTLTMKSKPDGQVPYVLPESYGLNGFTIAFDDPVVGEKKIAWSVQYDKINALEPNMVRSPMGANAIDWFFGDGFTTGDGFIDMANGTASLLEQDLTVTYRAGDEVRIDFIIEDYADGSGGFVRSSLRSFGDVRFSGSDISASGEHFEQVVLAADINKLAFFKTETVSGKLHSIRLTLVAKGPSA